MKKITLSTVPYASDVHPDLTKARVKMLISQDTVGSHRSMLSIASGYCRCFACIWPRRLSARGTLPRSVAARSVVSAWA